MLSLLYWLIVASLLSPALFARLIAYSQTSAASLCASCLRQATAARRSSRWELDRWTCNPQQIRKTGANINWLTFSRKFTVPYTKTWNQAGQVYMAWGKHMQLLQARDGSCLHKRVWVVLHYGTTNQAGWAYGGDGSSISYKTEMQIIWGQPQVMTILFILPPAGQKHVYNFLKQQSGTITNTKGGQQVCFCHNYPVILAQQWWWEHPDSGPSTGAPQYEMGAQ